MPLHPTNERLRERILMYGGPGSGKTFDYLKIADMAQKSGSDAKFYILDTDNASDRMLATEFGHLTNVVEPELCFDWRDLIDSAKKIRDLIRPQDWTMLDMIGPTWDLVQEQYIEDVLGKDYTQLFLDWRISSGGDAKKGNPLDGWKDWSVINKMYRELTTMILRWSGHFYATAPQTSVSSDNDSKEIKAMFGRLGVRPKGQKDISHHFHTVLWKIVNMNGWEMAVAKDRGRPIETIPVSNFALEYLVKRADWKLA